MSFTFYQDFGISVQKITLNPHLHEVLCGWCFDGILTLVSRRPSHSRITSRSLRANLSRLPSHTRISLCSPFSRWTSNSGRSWRSLRANLTRLPGRTRISLCSPFSRWTSNSGRSWRSLRANLTRLPGRTRISLFSRRPSNSWRAITRTSWRSSLTFSSSSITYKESKLRHVLKNSFFAHSTNSTPMYLIGLVMLL